MISPHSTASALETTEAVLIDIVQRLRLHGNPEAWKFIQEGEDLLVEIERVNVLPRGHEDRSNALKKALSYQSRTRPWVRTSAASNPKDGD